MGLMSFFKQFTSSAAKTKQITAQQLAEELKGSTKDKYFIDVRSKQEFGGSHIRNFVNIPLDSLQGRLDKLPKDKEIVVICLSGGRSSAACRVLQKAGFEQVTNVQGGMMAWDRVRK